MKIQSSHTHDERGLDAYFTPIEAVISLLLLEKEHIPATIYEPAAGNGAIVIPLRNNKYNVYASDIVDYGLEHCQSNIDYLKIGPLPFNHGIITNPPYKLAQAFAEKAINESNYVAFLLRTNFLESTARLAFFRKYPPTRIWISSRRLPMMHRNGWTGAKAESNTCYAWFIWKKEINNPQIDTIVKWFDWKELLFNNFLKIL